MGGARSLEINSLASRGTRARERGLRLVGFGLERRPTAAKKKKKKKRGGHPQEASHSWPASAAQQEVLQKSHSEAQLLNFSKHLFVRLEAFSL